MRHVFTNAAMTLMRSLQPWCMTSVNQHDRGRLDAQGIAEGTALQGMPLICDVRDVARAHVLAAEEPSASGRYIISHRAPLTATALSHALQVGSPALWDSCGGLPCAGV